MLCIRNKFNIELNACEQNEVNIVHIFQVRCTIIDMTHIDDVFYLNLLDVISVVLFVHSSKESEVIGVVSSQIPISN